MSNDTSKRRSYGPEYGLEAIRRLEAGFPIVYSEKDAEHTIIEEHPDGRRFVVRLEGGSIKTVRELSPRRE